MNAEIGLFCRMPCAPHSLLLHRIGCFPEAGRVNDAEGIAAEACLLLDRVARGARCLVHDSPLSSKQTVEQARFAGIWCATESQGDAFPE